MTLLLEGAEKARLGVRSPPTVRAWNEGPCSLGPDGSDTLRNLLVKPRWSRTHSCRTVPLRARPPSRAIRLLRLAHFAEPTDIDG